MDQRRSSDASENCSEEEKKCIQVCQSFLDGDWNKISSLHDVVIKRIEGGVSNRLFIVELKGKKENEVTSDRKVVIRFYGSSFIPNDVLTCFKSNEMTESRLVSKLSELNLCPKLLATFPGGRIEPFVQGNVVSIKELYEHVDLNLQIARKLALIHSLSTRKELFEKIGIDQHRILFTKDTLENYFSDFMKVESELNCIGLDDADAKIVEMFSNFDFETEKTFLIEKFSKMQSRIVFAHNDFNHTNFLITKGDPNNNEYEDVDWEKRLQILDFEYASFNYRWADIAIFFTEIQFKGFDGGNISNSVPIEIQKRFIACYLTEWSKLSSTGLNDIDTVEHLMEEVNLGSAIIHLVRVLFFLSYLRKNDPKSIYHTWKYTEQRMKEYLRIKELIK